MDKQNVSVIIIARQEEENLAHLLPSLSWVAQVLVVVSPDDTKTAQVATQNGAQVIYSAEQDFACRRNCALELATGEWLFYVDADERVTKSLQTEIIQTLKKVDDKISAIEIYRQNFHYGTPMYHGGWEKDAVTRIFRRAKFCGWQGAIHESPRFDGQVTRLQNRLWHFTHRCTQVNLQKSAHWTIMEAELLADDMAAKNQVVTKTLIVRKVVMEFYRRFWRDRGWRDGMAGFVESLVQAFNRGFVYIQVWELLQKPSLTEKYAALEKQVLVEEKES